MNRGEAISVIISTYNRAGMLERAMLSVLCQDFDANRFELIVVDNNCTDSTKEVVCRVKDTHKAHVIQYLVEPVQGLSAARNAGVGAATGELVAFMDDDSEAEPGWLSELWRVYHAFPDAASVGGRILPEWVGGRPDWLPPVAETLSRLDLGEEIKEIPFPSHPFGGNLSVRKDAFERVGGFSIALGRKKKGYLSNEEKDFYHRLAEAGCGRVFYAPKAIVFHKVFRDKITPRYLLSRFYWQGVSDAICEYQMNRPGRSRLFGNALTRIGKILKVTYQLVRRDILGERGETLTTVIVLAYELGQLRQEICAVIGLIARQ
ncbi:glycosyltransferase [Candidatus Poribacteria bacterium]|nr:glycosyltransferase [Candidatus Poribacteria bacterium]